ncbi:MAG: metal ABC transporter substrate-binding protein [Nocardioides sp.]
MRIVLMTRPSRSLVAALLVAGSLLTPLLSACGDAGPGPAGASGGRSVVAAFYPLAYVAGRVAGPFADVTNLTRPGGEPHDLELGFNQTVALHEADVVVYEAGFQPAVDDAVAGLSGEQVVDAARVVALHALPDHPDEVDPHFWQDPLLLADVADATADSLAAADPAHAADYAANAAVLRQDLVRLDREYTAGLTGCERSVVVVSHDASGVPRSVRADLRGDRRPLPRRRAHFAGLAALQKLARQEGITTVFSERLASPAMADTLAGDLGIRTAVLDPIEGLSDQTQGRTTLPSCGRTSPRCRRRTAVERAGRQCRGCLGRARGQADPARDRPRGAGR